MNNFNINALALGLSLALSAGAMADSIPKNQYQVLNKNITAEYEAAKAGCDSLADNANDICVADAKGKKNIAKTTLENNYKPTVKTQYNARIAIADAIYAVAIEQCDEKTGNNKDVCVKEAKAAKIQEESFAEAQMKTTKADAVAIEKTADARKDAVSDTREANYAVAKEKCEAFVDVAKESCLGDAKFHFGL